MICFIIGPTACGKSAVGRALAERYAWPFVDADDLHSAEARAKMASGVPLTDADRAPWLVRVRDAAGDAGPNAVVACSALKRAYRDVLRGASSDVRFVALDVPEAELRRRIERRSRTSPHFMPPSQLADQLRTFERPSPDEPDASVIAGDGALESVVERAARFLG